MKETRHVAIIGFGAIGQEVAAGLLAARAVEYRVSALLRKPERQTGLDRRLSVAGSLAELIRLKPDIFVEAAGQAAVQEHGADIAETGKPFVVASIGTFADEALWQDLSRRAASRGGKIVIPTGAIGGLDYTRAVAELPDAEIRYVSRKPPSAWADELQAMGKAPGDVRDVIVLFEGSARAAAQRYPKNLNVAATLAVAGIGMERTKVVVLVDPAITANMHEIEIRSQAGVARFSFENRPSRQNPKTSMVTALSVISAVRAEFE